MSQVNGKNVILYVQGEEESITVDVVDNMDGSQTVTVTWGDAKPAGSVLTTIGYNDGAWHDIGPVTGTHSGSITIPTATYVYRLSFRILSPFSLTTYSPLPTTVPVWKPYACGLNVTENTTTDFIETSVSGTGTSRTYKPTGDSWTAGFQGIVAVEEGMISLADLKLKQSNRELLYVNLQLTDDDGDIVLSEYGYAYISNSQYDGNFNGMANFSIELQGTGPKTQLSES